MSVVSSAFALKHAWLFGSCVPVSWSVLTEAASYQGWDWRGEPLWLALRALPPLVLPRPRAWLQRQAKSAAGEAVNSHADVARAAEASNSATAEAVQAHADVARTAEASSSAAAEAVQAHADVVRAAETSESTLVQAVKAHFDHLRRGSDDALEEQVTVAATATAAARAEGRSRPARGCWRQRQLWLASLPKSSCWRSRRRSMWCKPRRSRSTSRRSAKFRDDSSRVVDAVCDNVARTRKS